MKIMYSTIPPPKSPPTTRAGPGGERMELGRDDPAVSKQNKTIKNIKRAKKI